MSNGVDFKKIALDNRDLLNAALSREAALREELETEKRANYNAKVALKSASETCELWKGRTTNLTHTNADLQQRLTVAEQREAEIIGLAREAEEFTRAYVHGELESIDTGHFEFWEKLKAALKPAAAPTIEVARKSLSFENQRIQPARFHCLACGEYHEGSGNLPCPKMKPMSGVKP